MRCLADFILDSDLCLAEGAPALALNDPSGRMSLTLTNAEHDPLQPKSVLAAELVFEAPAFDKQLRSLALANISECLNVLTFTTNRKFAVVLLRRLIEWTPGLVDRRAIIFNEQPEWDLAEPALDQPFVETAQRLLAISPGGPHQEAMRWYRRGIEATDIEAQFSYFWFALEIVAEELKGTEKVPSKCPNCQSPLFCESCNTHPLHRRYAGEAIRHLIDRVHPDHSAEIFNTLQTIRHTLMHGGRIASVIDKLPFDEQQAVTKLAFVTWNAIFSRFAPDPNPGNPLDFGYVDNVARRRLVASAHVVTQMPGDQQNPHLGDFPKIDLTFKPLEQPT